MATYWFSSKSTAKFLRKWTLKVFISHTTVTINEVQGHPNLYQNVELSSPYHHTKFERNWSVNVWIQANVVSLFVFHEITRSRVLSLEYWMDETMSIRFITLTSLNSIPKFHPNWKLCQVTTTVLLSWPPVSLNQGQGQLRPVSKCRVQLYLSPYQVSIKIDS